MKRLIASHKPFLAALSFLSSLLVVLPMLSQMACAAVYSEDFTVDPEWPSDVPDYVKWDPAGFYRALVTDNPSGFKQWGYGPEFQQISDSSFTLEFDINPADTAWGTYPLLGLVISGTSHPFDELPLSISAEKAGEFPNNFVLRGKTYKTSSMIYFSSPEFTEGEWYHQKVDYAAETETLTWQISLVGEPFGSFWDATYTSIAVAPFNEVVVGYESTVPVYGSWAEIYVDNIKIVPEPSTLIIFLGIGAISLLVYVWRRRKRTA